MPEKCQNTEVFWFVFTPNVAKYGPGKSSVFGHFSGANYQLEVCI